MPFLSTTIGIGARGSSVAALHGELVLASGEIGDDEVTNGTFGETTQNSVLEFQRRYGLEQTGAVDPATGALLTASARFATEGNTPKLRQDLRAASNANPDEPALAHWLARYELLAGNYGRSRTAFRRMANMPGAELLRSPLDKILDEPSNTRDEPDLPYPGNFYTYRYSFFSLEAIERLHAHLTSLGFASVEATGAGTASIVFLRRRAEDADPIPDDLPDLPDSPQPETPNPPALPDEADLQRAGLAGYQAISAFHYWYLGNQDMARGLYIRAERNYSACQAAAVRYFLIQNPGFRVSSEIQEQMKLLISDLHFDRQRRARFWRTFSDRQVAMSLEELHRLTWVSPGELIARNSYDNEAKFLELLQPPGGDSPAARQEAIEAPLVTLAYALVPLARAEANRQRRNFNDALVDCDRVLNTLIIKRRPEVNEPVPVLVAAGPRPPTTFGEFKAPFKLACEFIELPFARALKAQLLLEKGDAEYKGRRTADARVSYQKAIDVFEVDGEYQERVVSAQTTYQADIDALLKKRFHPLAPEVDGASRLTAEDRRAFETLGKELPIPTVEAETDSLPGLDRRSGPHEPLLRFTADDGTTNPLIFALVMEAQARLLQIESGFNYLGYSDEYVPPWRFQFLLERARYFSEHAKNSQREYLNFLNNAENEEFQELSAAQNVTLEKSNVRIETALVEQTRLEIEAAKLGQELAGLTADNAAKRLSGYRKFDEEADDLSLIAGIGVGVSALGAVAAGAVGGFVAGGPVGAGVGAIIGGAIGLVSGGGQATAEIAQLLIANKQREFEEFNLKLSVGEAKKSAQIAGAQLSVARASLVVAGLKRSAALLRHEFAVQNLSFLRNRSLNAELWYRLSGLIRSVADTYIRYAVELAFLAEQAYEFEADKRINVIRFDYDVSEIGALLAADFLLKDLDTLEQDLIVNQRQRQQQVRYVLSLAREFPEALHELRDSGSTIFSLRLEQIERRFPGLYNLRIGAVDITPVVLMDPTRFSLELTYLGSSQVRLKAQPDTPAGVPSVSPLNTNDLNNVEALLFQLSLNQAPQLPAELDNSTLSDELRDEFAQQSVQLSTDVTVTQITPGAHWRLDDNQNAQVYEIKVEGNFLVVYHVVVVKDWLQEVTDLWPVKIRVLGPETAIFSGLTRQDVSAFFPFASTAQRGAFESLGAAAGWRIDMSMKENQVVPGSLADMLITLTLSGYHDPELRDAVDGARRGPQVLTQFLSARGRFPDAFYEFNQGGRMVWDVTEPMLSLDAPVRNLRNLGLILLPGPRPVQFSSLASTYLVELDVAADGQVSPVTPIPQIAIAIDRLKATVSAVVPAGAKVSFDFGEGGGFQEANQHTYQQPGKYVIAVRLVENSRLYEYRAEIAVSRTQTLTAPLTAFPSFAPAPPGQTGIRASTNARDGEDVAVIWRADQDPFARGSETSLNLLPGKHLVLFTAIRKLRGRVYGRQRFLPDRSLPFEGVRLSTNRVFELDSTETTGLAPNDPANVLTKHLFPEDSQIGQRLPLSPVDRWTLELRPDDNPFLLTVTPNDNLRIDLGELEDAILILEYETDAS
jgi:hypothetical protein